MKISWSGGEPLWSHIYWLSVLAETGSFTKAAERLGVSKSAVSQYIADLERAAGVALVLRTTRRTRLTDAGDRLVAETSGHFQSIASGFASVQDSAGEVRGVVSITAPVAFSRQQLVGCISQYLVAHPGVTVRLDATDRIVSLTTEGFDLAIRHCEQVPESLIGKVLCRTRSVLVASPDYICRAGMPRSPADLPGHNCLFYPRVGEAVSWSFSARNQDCNERSVTVSGSFAINNSEAIREAALNHIGIALLPDFSAQRSLQNGDLVQVLPEWEAAGEFAKQLHVIRPYSRHVPKAVQLLFAHIQLAFASGFPL